MLEKLIFVIFCQIVCLSTAFATDTLDGIWRVEGHPVWIEVTTQDSITIGKVKRHDLKPNSIGTTLLRSLKAVEGEESRSQAEVYADRLKRYTDVQLSLVEPTLEIEAKVGFMTHIVKWRRANDFSD